jgi:hypothetical protein
MSQLKVNAIRHTGASSDAVTLAADGTCTAKITNNLSNRNLVINGAMKVAQRGTSSTTSGYGSVDRFRVSYAGTNEAPTQAQHALTSSDTGPWEKGFRYSYHITNGNQTSGADTGDRVVVYHFFEAQDLVNSNWQTTSNSSYITLSFWVKSSVAQNFYFRFQTEDNTTQNYVMETGSLSANTWTKITKVIPGNTNLDIDNDNGAGAYIEWIMFRGTDNTGTRSLNTWEAYDGNARAPDCTSTWYTTNDATFEITGVQLEAGDVATDFEHRSYGYELERCKRYYMQFGGSTDATNRILFEGYTKSTSYVINTHLSYSMRAAPTVTYTSGWSENNFGSISFNYRDTNQCGVRLIANANDTCCFTHTDADSYLKFDAEL